MRLDGRWIRGRQVAAGRARHRRTAAVIGMASECRWGLQGRTDDREGNNMLIKLSTDRSVSETAAALQAAVLANHFGVMQVHDLRGTMAKKGVPFDRECLVFEVCQPQQAQRLLEQDMSVSTALPCRISVYEDGGKTIVATLGAVALLAQFDGPHLISVAQEVEDAIVKIMKEAVSNGTSGSGSSSTAHPDDTHENPTTMSASGSPRGTKIGFRTTADCLKERLLVLSDKLTSARQIGAKDRSSDGARVGWHRAWDRIEAVLGRSMGIVSDLERAVESTDGDHLAKAISAWEEFQVADDHLGRALAEIRTLVGEMSLAARTEWNLFAGYLETDLTSIYSCAQSLRLELELLKTHTREEIDRFLGQISSKLHSPSPNGQAEPYSHQYRRAVIELGREHHEFQGILDVVKGLAMWGESPSERMLENRSLKVDEGETVAREILTPEKGILH